MNDDDDRDPPQPEPDEPARMNPRGRDVFPPIDPNTGEEFPGAPMVPLDDGVANRIAREAGNVPSDDLEGGQPDDGNEPELQIELPDVGPLGNRFGIELPPMTAQSEPQRQPQKQQGRDWEEVENNRKWRASVRQFEKTGQHTKWGQEQLAAAGAVPQPDTQQPDIEQERPNPDRVVPQPERRNDDVEEAWQEWRRARGGNVPIDDLDQPQRPRRDDNKVDNANPQGNDKDQLDALVKSIGSYLQLHRDVVRSLISMFDAASADMRADHGRLEEMLVAFERGREGY
jgi:hypothetical protein